jgi:hypothetical protein
MEKKGERKRENMKREKATVTATGEELWPLSLVGPESVRLRLRYNKSLIIIRVCSSLI